MKEAADLGTLSRCAEALPECSRVVTCEALLSRTDGRYLLLPVSFAAALASRAQAAAEGGGGPAAFEFVVHVYSAHPVQVRRKEFSLPALPRAIHAAVKARAKKELTPVRFDCLCFALFRAALHWSLCTDAFRSHSTIGGAHTLVPCLSLLFARRGLA